MDPTQDREPDKDGYTRGPSTRVRPAVNYDDKRHLMEDEDFRRVPAIARNGSRNGDVNGDGSALGEPEEPVGDLDESSWETESLFEDAIEDLAEDLFFTDVPDACTPDEAVRFRQMLRAMGPEEFCKRNVDSGLITAKKMLTAFGIRPPDFLEGSSDDAYFGLLTLALSRELSKRAKLLKYNSIDDAVSLLKTCKNIIVLTGAGISTSLGIPDFRSKGTGLYSKLEHLGLNDPQEVFDIDVFKEDPTIFYTVARDILPSTERFSPTHAFIALLQEKGKLLTNYSQNIDNLEAKAGIRPDKLVQCHGSFATATCVKCGYQVPGEAIFPDMKAGTIPRCSQCAADATKRSASSSRKRKIGKDGTEKKPRRRPGDYDSNSDSEFDNPAGGSACGVMKPDIIFFGEALPDTFSRRLRDHDRGVVDLVIVIGTSLKVAPVSDLVPFLPAHVPQIYISRTAVGHVNFDIDLLGDCDVIVAELCRRAGWDLNHEMVPQDQVVDVALAEGYPSRHVFTQVWPAPPGSRDGGFKVTAAAEAGAEVVVKVENTTKVQDGVKTSDTTVSVSASASAGATITREGDSKGE